MSIKRTYRIEMWRFDIPRQAHSKPEFDGETVDECDKQAIRHFQTVSEKVANQWYGMDLVRIDTPAVAEKVTHLSNNGRQGGGGDYDL